MDFSAKLISPEKLTKILVIVVVCLVILSLAGQVARFYFGHSQLWGLVPLFYIDREANIPTWYSSMALLWAGLLLGMVSAFKRRQKAPYRRHWTLLSFIFVFLSIDEIAMIHEWPIFPIRAALGTGGVFYYAWVIPGIAIVILLGLAYLKFVLALPSRIRNLFILAGVVFISGAIGVEMISGIQASSYGEANMTYVLIITVEEMCEMLGVVIFIRALMEYLETMAGSFRLTVGPA